MSFAKVNMILQGFLKCCTTNIIIINSPAKWERKDINYISFSHLNDVRPPVNTPDGDCGEQHCALCPLGSLLCNSWEYSYLLLWDQDQTQLQPYYSWKICALQHDSGEKRRNVYDCSTL